MTNALRSLVLDSTAMPEVPFDIPGVTRGGVTALLLNIDAARGLVTTIIRIMPGARIPAHFHRNGSEAHYVLEGDFINDGVAYGPGGFVTHSAGTVHGPQESASGCRVLTLQTAFVDPLDPDFHLAGDEVA